MNGTAVRRSPLSLSIRSWYVYYGQAQTIEHILACVRTVAAGGEEPVWQAGDCTVYQQVHVPGTVPVSNSSRY
jgi:hypothetical protein